MDKELLQKAGLTRSEVEVFLALLELGSTNAGPLVTKTGLHRSRVYEALERLQQKGLVGFILRSKRRYFEAAHPDRLLEYTNNKKEELNKQEESIKEIIPDLIKIKDSAKTKEEALIFKGYKGVKTFLEQLVNEAKNGDTIYAFGVPKEMRLKWGGYFKEYHKKRIKKGVLTKLIYDFEAVKDRHPRKLMEWRYFKKGTSTPAEVAILNDIVGIVMPSKEPIVFMIRNKEVAKSFLTYFNILWGNALKIKDNKNI